MRRSASSTPTKPPVASPGRSSPFTKQRSSPAPTSAKSLFPKTPPRVGQLPKAASFSGRTTTDSPARPLDRSPSSMSFSSSAASVPEEEVGESITVVVRTRPLSEVEIASYGRHECLSMNEEDNTATVQQFVGQQQYLRPTSGFHSYKFDHVFPADAPQHTVFDRVGTAACDHFLEGYNVAVLAYGQTGAGKTFTMLGDVQGDGELPSLGEQSGMIPRSLKYIFEGAARLQAEGNAVKIRVSLIEIYNETVVDLLSPDARALTVREHPRSEQTYADQAVEASVRDPDQCLKLLNMGALNRTVGATAMNKESSRSHLVFSLSMTVTDALEASERRAQFNLVDLAGSERQKLTRVEGRHLKEASSINQSLTALGKVIMALAAGSKHVPYRDSKLTFLLKNALGGNSKTFLIANVSPSPKNEEETLSTLKFASFARKPRMFTRKNILNKGANVETLLNEITKLKAQLEQAHAGLPSSPERNVGYKGEVERLEGLLSDALQREVDMRGELDEERRRFKSKVEGYENLVRTLEESLQRSRDTIEGKNVQFPPAGEAEAKLAAAEVRIQELEDENGALRRGGGASGVQERAVVDAQVADLTRQLSALMSERRDSFEGNGEASRARELELKLQDVTFCMDELTGKHLCALEMMRELRDAQEPWVQLANEGWERQDQLEKELYDLKLQMIMKNDIIKQLSDEQANIDGYDGDAHQKHEDVEKELDIVKSTVIELRMQKERYEDEINALKQDKEILARELNVTRVPQKQNNTL